jgi:hypothetical protein
MVGMKMLSLAKHLKNIVSFLPSDEGEIKKKIYPEPKIKPPRRNPSIRNKSDASGYMKEYMQEYRGEGKNLQKTPDKIKQYRRQQRKKLKEQLRKRRPLQAALIDQELTYWATTREKVPMDEFNFICSRRGFNDEERGILAEELEDLGLIII